MTSRRLQRTISATLRVVTAGLVLTAAGCERSAPPAQPRGQRPNIILILSDDQASRAFSTEGNTVVRTPNLQRMADEGTYFSRAYVPLPQCAPSRGAIITGRYPHEHGPLSNIDGGLKPGAVTLAHRLRDAGYRCGMLGKWHLSDPKGDDRFGFDDAWIYANVAATPRNEKYTRPLVVANGVEKRFDRWLGDVLTDYALEFIDKPDPKPFFLWLGYYEPHVPLTPSPAHPVDPAAIVAPPSAADDLSGKPRAQRTGDPHLLYQQSPPEAIRTRTAAYYSMINALDANLGRILDHLKQRGLAENTLVVFISDNGWMLGEHQMWSKGGMLYEELVRMPVFFRQPGTVPAGKKVSALASSLDFFPTLLAVAGAKIPAETAGRDLWPLITGTTPANWRDEIFLEYRGGELDRPNYFVPMLGVVTQRYKYTRYLLDSEEELYDLETDPFEMRNLVKEPAAEAILADHRGRVNRFQGGIRNKFWEKPTTSPAPAGGGD